MTTQITAVRQSLHEPSGPQLLELILVSVPWSDYKYCYSPGWDASPLQLTCNPSAFCHRYPFILLGWVVKKMDNSIHWINHYPVDSVPVVGLLILIHWIAILYPLDSAIQPLNNRALGGERHCKNKESCPRTQHSHPGQGSIPDRSGRNPAC